jgi:hypothetical protein
MSHTPKDSTEKPQWSLIPLTPEYLEAEHSGYVSALQAALEDDETRNIALSGNYGVGKSSILRELGKRLDGRVVELSLSTLAPIEVSRLDESVPIQATTPTNRIQQEIVKQLLYREDPSKTPASRFRRIERFQWRRELGTAVLLGLAAAVVFLLTEWTAQIAATFTVLNDLGVWAHLVVWGAAAIAVLMVRWLSYGKLRIKQFSAGAATVTLDDNAVSYFDQYLDEIVYFFDVSDRDVLIFEDIDRFNDSHIFETLRALNTLLNASPQIAKPIRFIYAIKDSIFDRIGLEAEGRKLETGVLAIEDPAQAEAVRANRTKFFDLVIPVVPFITHRSARNLATQLLGKIEHKVAPELLDLAAQYVPDMRLLKNVRNEFIVFRDRIFSGDGEQLDLSETDLFAMMLYKSTHLTDFETIRLGKSNLDTVYKLSRELVAENIKRTEGERRALRQRLTRITGAATRSAQLGARLLAHVQRVAAAAGYQRQNVTYIFESQRKSVDDLKSVQFWTSFVASDSDPALQWRNNYGQTLSFTRSHLATELGDPLDADSWSEADRDSLNEQIEDKAEEIKFLRSADLGDLVRRPEFLVTREKTARSLASVAEELLKPGLAYQLVRAGYLNRNFTLYTSTFHGDRVSPAATNFIIHHVERDLMDEHFTLPPEDVDAVVRERGKEALKEPALYNIDILDRLLTGDVDAADIMIRSLLSLGENQARFLQAYLASGEQRLKFIGRFAALSSGVLVYLVSQLDLDDAARLELVDTALAHLSSKQRTDRAVPAYLLDHYAELASLTSDSVARDTAQRLAMLFAEMKLVVPRLEPLGRHVRQAFVARNLYEIAHENLTIAIENTATVALDAVREADETVYDYVLEHLGTYLEAIEGLSATVDSSDHFISVIEDVLGHGEPYLGDVVGRAGSGCEVKDLVAVPEAAWSVLAEHRRFPATFGNVHHYVTALDSIDAALAKVLSKAGEISEIQGFDEESKATLAVEILAARDQLPSALLRANLVGSMHLDETLDADTVAPEVGELFALLLKCGVIPDEAETYERLATTDWSTRRAFIRESTGFANYMTPSMVRPDLALLLSASNIDEAIKQVIVEQAAEYAKVAGPRGLQELARFATQRRHELPIEAVQKMAQEKVPAQQIVALLEPHLGSIDRSQLFTILEALEGDYPSLTEVGRDKPRIPNTRQDRALLEQLKQDGIVSSYEEDSATIKVHKRHKVGVRQWNDPT